MIGFSCPIRCETPDIPSKLLAGRAGNRRYRQRPCQRSGITSPDIKILVPAFWAPPQAGASGPFKGSIPRRCATGCTGKLSSCRQSINVRISSELASLMCATRLHIQLARRGALLLPRFQPIRPAAFLAICRASFLSYTYVIHRKIEFPVGFFGPSPQERRPVAGSVPGWCGPHTEFLCKTAVGTEACGATRESALAEGAWAEDLGVCRGRCRWPCEGRG